MTYADYVCKHPLFQWASEGRWNASPANLKNPCVFVFERKRWKTPTKEEVQEYREREKTVISLGGRMRLSEWEIAGENPVLSEYDVAEILDAVKRDFPTSTIVNHWNGARCYCMSVGVDLSAAEGTK